MAIKLPVSGGAGEAYLKASEDFSATPRAFKIWKDPEYVKADNPKFGDRETGMQYKFYLEENGTQYTLNSTSKRLAFAFNQAQVNVGDSVAISKTGTGYETAYTVKKASAPNPLMEDDAFPIELMRP